MISDKRMEQALVYLAETDLPCAELLADVERLEHKAKVIKQTLFLHFTDLKTATERVAKAETHESYQYAMDEYFAKLKEYGAVKNKRATEEIVVGVWRSVSANRRQG